MFTTKARRTFFIAALAGSLLFALVAVEYFQALDQERVRNQALSEIQTEFIDFRANLESEINAAIYSAWGVASYLTAHPDSDESEWLSLSKSLVDSNNNIRNIAIAPGNKVAFVYPLAGNEAILNFDYEELPEQLAAVKLAEQNRQMVLAGPVNLIQGGVGFINRIPIFSQFNNQDLYWGVIAVVIDSEKLYQAVGLETLLDKYQLAIRGVDGSGPEGKVFLGEEQTFTNADFLGRVRFPNGTWQLGLVANFAQATSFWDNHRIRLIGYPYIVTLYIMLFTLFAWYRTSYGESMLDPLTNVANRRLVMERLQTLVYLYERHPTPFAVVVVDIDRFKQINDEFGHQAGDQVLKTIAQRMLAKTRATDTVARTGGDEFLVVLMGISDKDLVSQQSEKLAEAIAEPIHYNNIKINISASLGHALFPSDGKTVDALIHSADDHMYQNKRCQ